jgi:hypothetical protein
MEAEHILANMRHLHSDATQQTLQVMERLQEVANVVTNAARVVNNGKTLLYKQNEELLMREVQKITIAINTLQGMEGAMQLAARTQADAVVRPLYEQISAGMKALHEKDTYAMNFLKQTQDIQKTMALNMLFAIAGALILFFSIFVAGVKIGKLESPPIIKKTQHTGVLSVPNPPDGGTKK